VTKLYGAMAVLKNLWLSLKSNKFMVFHAPSGCGWLPDLKALKKAWWTCIGKVERFLESTGSRNAEA
jgi:ABC-type proline/glycine betaine transport system ATPase subunit